MQITNPARLSILALFTASLILPSLAQAQSSRSARYGDRDARYVIDTRDGDVLDYVICLEESYNKQPRRLSKEDALDNANDDCRTEQDNLPRRSARSTIREVNQAILDCGFSRADAPRGSNCGRKRTNTATNNGNNNSNRPGKPPRGQGPNIKNNNGNNSGGRNNGRNNNGNNTAIGKGFPVSATSLGGRVRSSPSTSGRQVGSTGDGKSIVLLNNAGRDYKGYPWFSIRTNSGKTGYQWGGGICMNDNPIKGIKGKCEVKKTAQNPKNTNNTRNGNKSGGKSATNNNSTSGADVAVGILNIIGQVIANKNDKKRNKNQNNNNNNNNNIGIVAQQRLNVVPGNGYVQTNGNLAKNQLAIYTVSGLHGQTLEVNLASANNNAVFEIYVGQARDGGTTLVGAGSNDNAQYYYNQLPTSGDFQIVVGSLTSDISYQLDVALEDPNVGGPAVNIYDPATAGSSGVYPTANSGPSSCNLRGSAVSSSIQTGATTRFINNSSGYLYFYWIDYSGVESDYSANPNPIVTLAPGQSEDLAVRQGFMFSVFDQNSNCLNVLEMDQMNNEFAISG